MDTILPFRNCRDKLASLRRKTKGNSKGIRSLRKNLSLIFVFWGLIWFLPTRLNTSLKLKLKNKIKFSII